jgi:hypothetical protein
VPGFEDAEGLLRRDKRAFCLSEAVVVKVEVEEARGSEDMDMAGDTGAEL